MDIHGVQPIMLVCLNALLMSIGMVLPVHVNLDIKEISINNVSRIALIIKYTLTGNAIARPIITSLMELVFL